MSDPYKPQPAWKRKQYVKRLEKQARQRSLADLIESLIFHTQKKGHKWVWLSAKEE